MASGLTLAVYGLLLVPAAVFVWRRPVVALYAWIVGLAAHNAVMAALYGAGVRGGALTAIQAWKEILLAVALARVGSTRCARDGSPFRVHAGRRARAGLRRARVRVRRAAAELARRLGRPVRDRAGAEARPDSRRAYFLGRSLCVASREELVPLAWTLLGAARRVALLGLLDDFFVSISWWRDSAVVDYFHKHLGYDYNGTGGLPENFIYNTGSEDHFLRRLVSVFLGPLASAYLFVVALLARRRAVAGGARVARGAVRADRGRAAVHVLALVAARARRRSRRARVSSRGAGGRSPPPSRRSPSAPRGCTSSRTSRRRESGRSRTSCSSATSRSRIPARAAAPAASTSRRSTATGSASARACAPSIHHPQGYGLGNAGQTASRTETPIKAGESNYTEIGAETGLLGSLLWTAWGLATLVALVARGAAHRLVGGGRGRGRVRRGSRSRRPDGRHRRSVDGLLPVGARRNRAGAGSVGRRMAIDPASGHRARSPEGERHRARARVLP